MKRVAFLTLAILVSAGSLCAQPCGPDHWFKTVDVTQFEDGVFFQLEASDSAKAGSYFQDEAHKRQLEEAKGLKLRLTVNGRQIDLEPTGARKVNDEKFTANFEWSRFTSLPGSPTGIALVIPPARLFCEDELVPDEVLVPVSEKATMDEGTEVMTAQLLSAGAMPWITNFDIGAAGEDEEGDGVLAVDFDFGKSFSFNDSRIVNGSWRELRGTLDFSGSFSTKEKEYFSALKGKFGASYRTTDLEGRNPLVTTWIAKVDAGPEATSDGDDIDYVYAARAQAILGLKIRTGNRRFFQPYPLIGLAVEVVDPDKREDGSVPKNYTRAVADVYWHLYLTDEAALEIDGEVRRLLDRVEGMDRWSRRWDFTLLVNRDDSWKPFLKYSRGEEGPTFEFHEEVLAGIKLSFPPKQTDGATN